MTANELEKMYLTVFAGMTAHVPEGAPSAIDPLLTLGLDARFVLGGIIHHAQKMKHAGFPAEMYLEQLRNLNSLLKDAGFTILFDEKVLD